ncbi:hypothetical protein BFW01_g10928 [Lasiodiplodia theobromae]|uniref:Uncharacterized protein n=2 Tax=Lasiodiplodia theobromae TaxID=45133 RepID=A0A5N5DV25_9PEZI|nr:hypothetical protein DBV05_g10 [Lasiodiplodia theobromae]KAF9629725.1 hypothetical protein BFW01_g10928 [Lasiodiplodia theobromae]
MSWSAPSSGGAPAYQPAPAYAQQHYPQQQAYGQPPYTQPPYQQSAPPSTQSSSAPTTYPPKRKGNPVITRYPPPPGYRPPPPPSGQPPYGQGQYPQPNYQQQPQGYPPQSYPQGYPGYQQPSQGYQPPWQPPPGYPPPQGYQQQGYQQPPPPPPPDASSPSTAYPPNGFQQSPTFPPSSQSGSYPPHESAISPTTTAPPLNLGSPPNQNSRPSKSRRNTRTASIAPTEVPESHKLYQSEAYTINLGLDEWDQTDFDGAIWPKANEPVDSNFSLGVIIWHPANETTRALSSDFVSAEERAAKPPLPKIGNGDSVSEYFGPENAHEAFLNVRQTDEWDLIRHDSIFYEFPKTSDIVALEDVLANRDRPDPEGENPYPNIHELQERKQRQGASWNVMDNLEQALSSEQAEDGGSRKQSRVDQSTPPPPPASRDDAQEALLASLGVTGSPKPVTQMPTPTFLPPKPPKPSARKGSDHDR